MTEPREPRTPEETPPTDPVFSRICETSTRLMAGVPQRKTIRELQKQVRATDGEYPWESVVERVLDEPVDGDVLVRQALRGEPSKALEAD